MGRRHSQIDAELQALYDLVPDIPDCRGRCWASCGPIDMSDRERQRIRKAGIEITPVNVAKLNPDTFWCEALTDDKRCAVYELRPMVCRLWGATESMPCPFGCIPEGGWMDAADAAAILAESLRIGGHDMSDSMRGLSTQMLAALYGDETMRKMWADSAAKTIKGTTLREREAIPEAFRRRPR